MPAWLANGWKAAVGAVAAGVFGAGVTWGTLNADVKNNETRSLKNEKAIEELVKGVADLTTATAVVDTKIDSSINQTTEIKGDVDKILNLLLSGAPPR